MPVQIDKQSMIELAEIVAKSVVTTLEEKGLIGKASAADKPKQEKTAYQKTEQLLYNYRGFQRIVEERKQEIDDLRRYGVPQKCGGVSERVCSSPVQSGIVLPEESVEIAVRNVEKSVEGTVQAIALIDKCMASLRNDPYYSILEMRYFEGRTQEDIAVSFGCNQTTIARNKSRLIKELAMRLFPNQVIEELMQ